MSSHDYSALQHELDLGRKFGELIATYKLVYGHQGDDRMLSLLFDVADQLRKVQGSLEPELEFTEGMLNAILSKQDRMGWKCEVLHDAVNSNELQSSINSVRDKLTKWLSEKPIEDDIGTWSHP